MIIAAIGPDGSGKSTYIKIIGEELEKRKKDYVIYYPFNYLILRRLLDFFSKNKSGIHKNKKQIIKNKKNIFKFWPIIALLDNWVDYIFRLKKRNRIVLCDRYYYDLATSFQEFGFTFNCLYHWYVKLIPRPDICFIFNGDAARLQKRETNDCHTLDFFKRQRERYQRIAEHFPFIIINTNENIKICRNKIINTINKLDI